MAQTKDRWRMLYHLMPPEGWLNDPNGLCQFKGIYHIFFQYSPKEPGPDGRIARTWGHYAGPDLMHLTFQGVPFWPVDPEDHDGCYSGSALLEGDEIWLYYTGNVKESGQHDYTYSGRQANEILVRTDGDTFGSKEVLLKNSDYPEDCTCHVRDPKVWKDDQGYHMVLGARVKSPEQTEATDFGEILFYQSNDGINWTLQKTLTSKERFGYMWECPDYFELDGKNFLSFCPQGLAHEEEKWQNIHQSGYAVLSGKLEEEQEIGEFHEWDMGFDFYAPQTFEDEAGRRILIGWVGLPDKPYGNPTADLKEGSWENCLTLPRVLTVEGDRILQNPVEELEELRYDETMILPSNNVMTLEEGAGDFEIAFLEGTEDKPWTVRFGTGTSLSYADGLLRLEIDEKEGAGRTVRNLRIDRIEFVRILVDRSILEIYINDGQEVMTSRFYPEVGNEGSRLDVTFDCHVAAVTGWQMKAMETNR